MYIKINRKRTLRYPGTDSREWRVVSYTGSEMSREEPFLVATEPKKVYEMRLVNRWSGFKTANRAAKALGGVAVRA